MSSYIAPIGYYVHHHGAGHHARFDKIRRASSDWIVPISELAIAGGVQIDSDVPEAIGTEAIEDPCAGGALHWAPIGDHSLRVKQISDWVNVWKPRGAVIDVSVEAALLFRLLGVPTIVVRQHGVRTDPAHELAYRSAGRLLAPYPIELEHSDTPAWVADKTVHCGFVMDATAPHDARPDFSVPHQDIPDENDVVVLWGRGGGQLDLQTIGAIGVAARPGKLWLVGEVLAAGATTATNVHALGWVDEPGKLLVRRPTVVASAGNNIVADVARSGSGLIVVAQPRPFGEQHRHAESLEAAEAAAAMLPTTDSAAWRSAMTLAGERAAALARLAQADGANVAADLISSMFAAGASHPLDEIDDGKNDENGDENSSAVDHGDTPLVRIEPDARSGP